MPHRLLRFCRKCLVTRQTLAGEICQVCHIPLLPLLDDEGAISREFLVARNFCCSLGCRNCPYDCPPPPNSSTVDLPQRKFCPQCGAGFDCLAGECWCHDVRLTPATLKFLARAYTDCLCPQCLNSVASAD